MQLNSMKPAAGAKTRGKRVGRGTGSGQGKTAGRGHKGQKSRSGGYHKVGFEGGQMPLQRRLPKTGFNSHLARITAEIRLSQLDKLDVKVIDINALRAANLIARNIKRAKVIATGEINKAIILKGIRASKGARLAIEAAGGSVEE